MPIPFNSISLIIGSPFTRSLHIRLTFLLSIFRFILSIPFCIHCLVPCTTSQYLFPFSTVFSYTASLSITPPLLPLSPFYLSAFPSPFYWLYTIYILALTHPLIHPSSHWLELSYYPSTIVPSVPLMPTGQ